MNKETLDKRTGLRNREHGQWCESCRVAVPMNMLRLHQMKYHPEQFMEHEVKVAEDHVERYRNMLRELISIQYLIQRSGESNLGPLLFSVESILCSCLGYVHKDLTLEGNVELAMKQAEEWIEREKEILERTKEWFRVEFGLQVP